MVRPTKNPEDRRTNQLRIRLTDAERQALDNAVQGDVSTWAREVLLREAGRLAKRASGEKGNRTLPD